MNRDRDAERAQYARATRLRYKALGLEPPSHGLSGYVNYACRCDTCVEIGRTYFREYRANHGKKARPEGPEGPAQADREGPPQGPVG